MGAFSFCVEAAISYNCNKYCWAGIDRFGIELVLKGAESSPAPAPATLEPIRHRHLKCRLGLTGTGTSGAGCI